MKMETFFADDTKKFVICRKIFNNDVKSWMGCNIEWNLFIFVYFFKICKIIKIAVITIKWNILRSTQFFNLN